MSLSTDCTFCNAVRKEGTTVVILEESLPNAHTVCWLCYNHPQKKGRKVVWMEIDRHVTGQYPEGLTVRVEALPLLLATINEALP